MRIMTVVIWLGEPWDAWAVSLLGFFIIPMKPMWKSFMLKDTVGAHCLLTNYSVLYHIHFPDISPFLPWKLAKSSAVNSTSESGLHLLVYCYQALVVNNYTSDPQFPLFLPPSSMLQGTFPNTGILPPKKKNEKLVLLFWQKRFRSLCPN